MNGFRPQRFAWPGSSAGRRRRQPRHQQSEQVDPLLAAGSWRQCALVDAGQIRQRHYVRFNTKDAPGVIGKIGGCFGERGVSIQSIVQMMALRLRL